MNTVGVMGSGIFLPERVVANGELEAVLGLQQGFIEQRTGIQQRRWTTEGESVTTMAVEASVAAVKDAGVDVVNCVIVCRDVILTRRALSIALPILERLRGEGVAVDGAYSMDFCNYCPSFIHALHMAELMVRHEQVLHVLVVASTDYRDVVDTTADFNFMPEAKFSIGPLVQQYSLGPEQCYQPPKLNAFLWGCGAGAVVVGRTAKDGLAHYKACGSRNVRRDAYGIGETTGGSGFGSLDGPAIYQFAVTEVPAFLQQYLESCGLFWADIDFLIPHQPNPRILRELGKRLGLPSEKVLVSCDMLGNMIAASLPITYHLNRDNGKLRPGLKVLLCSFGDSYLTVAAMLIEVL